jgi:hypothetical protein
MANLEGICPGYHQSHNEDCNQKSQHPNPMISEAVAALAIDRHSALPNQHPPIFKGRRIAASQQLFHIVHSTYSAAPIYSSLPENPARAKSHFIAL